MGAFGIGTVYGTAVPNAVKWFPDKRGLAGGLIVAGFGSGSVIFAPIFGAATASMGLLETFRLFGIIFAALVVIAAFFIASPPEGYRPAGWTPPATGVASAAATASLAPSQMLRTPRFWLLFAIFTAAMVGGIMIIGQAGNIAVNRIGLEPGVPLIATAVLFLGISNASGRLIWGAISDKIGRYPALLIMYVITAAMLVVLTLNTGNYPLFVISAMGVGVCFGGMAGTFPSISADNFGTAHMGTNYGILFIGFGISAFTGPQMAARIYDSTGRHDTAFIIALVLSAIAFVLTLALMRASKKKAA